MHFKNNFKKLLEPNWQNKNYKYRRAIFIKNICNNSAFLQINSQEKFLIKINKDFD